MKSYYNAKDIQEITGCKQTKAYEIIRELQSSFEKKYPQSIKIQGRIPIWYFEEIMMNKKMCPPMQNMDTKINNLN